jgi:hypothetical protein
VGRQVCIQNYSGETSWEAATSKTDGEIMQYKAVLVYFKHYIGSTENMAGINNMNMDGSGGHAVA